MAIRQWRFIGMLMLCWTAVVAASLLWNWRQVDASATAQAYKEAQSHFEKDLLVRRWGAIQGGVYVAPTDKTPPNPHLAHLKDRDVVTTGGKALTLVNPAYMTRQIYELAASQYGVRGHITSLKPIRPQNTPDDWERRALESFEGGVKEVAELVPLEGGLHLRFMRPLVTEAMCLKCHEAQGYKVGDVRGGISVSVPFAPFAQIARQQRGALLAGHLVIGFLGLAGLWLGGSRLQRSEEAQRRALAEAQRLARQEELLLASIGEGLYGVDAQGRCMFINPVAVAMLGFTAEEVVGRNQHRLFHSIRPDGSPYPDEECPIYLTLHDGARREVEDAFLRKDGRHFPVRLTVTPMRDDGAIVGAVVAFQDITPQRQMLEALRIAEQRLRAMLDASGESAMLLDPTGKVLTINEMGARRFGRLPEQMEGSNFFDFLPAELAAIRRAVLQQAVAGGEPLHTRDRRDGISFDNSIYPVKGPTGAVESIAVYAKDVTEQQRGEKLDALFHRLDLMLLKWRMNMAAIAQMFCDEALPLFDFVAAWIGRAEKDGRLTLLADAGRDDRGFLDQVRASCCRWQGESSCGGAANVVRDGHAHKLTPGDAECAACQAAAGAAGIGSMFLLPLVLRGENWGVLALYSRTPGYFDQPDIPPRLAAVASRLSMSFEAALQQEWLALLDLALETTSNAVFITDDAGRIVWSNRAFHRISGYASEELLGKTPKLFSSGRHDPSFYEHLWQAIRAGETWRSEVVNARRDGSLYTVAQTITPLREADDRISHYVAVVEDISERKAAAARIEHLAHFDILTDLPNRGLFLDRLAQALALSRRRSQPGALLFLDLDHFKEVNDRLGHEAGDRLLQTVAARLRGQVRESDTVARLAGDEFTVILAQVAATDDAARVADKIIAAIAEPFDLGGHQASVGVSIGIACFPEHGDDVESILNAADEAMYRAKAAGRNTWRSHPPTA